MIFRKVFEIQRIAFIASAAIGWLAVAHADVTASPQAGGAVEVVQPAPPVAEQLAGASVPDLIVHHATTHYVNSTTAGNLARWRGGLQSLCPRTDGLTPGYNAFVTARVRALAEFVGAPVQADPQCKSNVQITF